MNYDDECDPVIQRMLKLRESPNAWCATLYDFARENQWGRARVLQSLVSIDKDRREAYAFGTPSYRHRVWQETGVDPGPDPAEQLDYDDQSDPVVRKLMWLQGSPSALVAGLYRNAKRNNAPRSRVMGHIKRIEDEAASPKAYVPGTARYKHRLWLESLEMKGPTRVSESAEVKQKRTSSEAPPSKETIAHDTRSRSEVVLHEIGGSDAETSAPPKLDKTGSWYYGPFDFDRSQSDDDQAWKIPYQQVIAEVSEDYYLGEDHKRFKNPKYERMIAEAWRRVEEAGIGRGAGKTIHFEDTPYSLSTERDGDMIFMREIHRMLLEDDWEDRYLDRTG